MPDEFVRHKLLDAVGDLALALGLIGSLALYALLLGPRPDFAAA